MEKAKKAQDYFLGLDMGTDSLGWAVTDTAYNLLKTGGKAMWGVHLFDSGKTAEERRAFRTARRRTERNRQRIELLRELFSEEICKVDENFFARLDESKFYEEDKRVAGKYTLFNDVTYTDKEYHRDYPTIYHLRSALLHSDEQFDIRLLYLAVAHILKHRGHFLMEGQTLERATDFAPIFADLMNTLEDSDISVSCSDSQAVADVLKDKSITVTDKKRTLYALFGATEKQQKSVCDALAGGSVKLSVLFADESLDDCEVPKFDFKGGIEDKEAQLESALQDRMGLLLKLKAVYDWSVLADVLDGHEYLSDAKVATYEQHKNDLKVLRAVFRKYAPNEYNKMFRSDKEKYNYCAYTGHPSKKGEAVVDKRNVLQEDFCKFALKLLGDFTPATPAETDLKAKLQAGTALPKQATKDNSVLPYQIHLRELQVILDHSKQHYAFLNTEQDGTTVADKIIKLMTFRIPYYVGPLNPTHGNAWIVRKETGKIYPWNFDDKVDKIKSAEQFIQRKTNFCTYLVGEKVLPKESVLYSKFVIYNQLNSIAVDGQKLPPALKNALFQDLFLQPDRAQKVTVKRLQNYLFSKGYCEKSAEITGLDGEVRGTMKSYIELRKILGDKVNDTQMTEEIIYQITVLGESKKLLQVFLQRTFGDRLSAEEMHNLLRLNYSGWGNLSETFLTGIYHIDKATGEAVSILSALENTTDNLMQLLSGKYGFTDAVNLFNADKNGQITAANAGQAVDELAVSPAVKRSIRRTLAVIKETTKVMGHAPKRIFLEVARGPAESQKNQRTQSRKQALLDCYAACKREESALFEALDKAPEDTLRKDKLYLYYTQLGRCMYSGEPIDLADLYDKTKYDIDHIYPRSQTKDDSLNNRVLVQRVLNEKKGKDPVPSSMRNAKTVALWKRLLELNLISKEKYYRLMRTTPLSAEELAGFIARQLVETRQSSKATAQLLAQLYPNSEVVYSKAKNVSEFRTEFKFDKCRSVNDYHHAKDAYLNIVVGNVYHVKFTNNPVWFLKSGEDYSLKCVFKHPVQRGGETAWLPDGSYIATVRKTMAKNNILFTRYATEQKGAFFDQQPVKKGSGQMPLKTGDPRLADFQKYGGYNKVAGAYFALVRHTVKGKRVKTFESVPVYKAKYFEQHPEALLPYFAETLQDPEILLPKVKINTLFSVDGFKMHLSGRTGSQLLFKNANQLVLSEQQYAYFHRIDKWIEQNKKYKSIQPISPLRKLTDADNIELYDALHGKLRETVYNRCLSAQVKTFTQCRDKFIALPLEEQCIFLSNMLKMFQCNSMAADLTLCGGAASAGGLKMNKDITKLTNIKLIFQSVTGLFENELDLASL